MPFHTQSTISTAQVVLIQDSPLGTCRQELYSLFSVCIHMAICPIHRKTLQLCLWVLWSMQCKKQIFNSRQPMFCCLFYCRIQFITWRKKNQLRANSRTILAGLGCCLFLERLVNQQVHQPRSNEQFTGSLARKKHFPRCLYCELTQKLQSWKRCQLALHVTQVSYFILGVLMFFSLLFSHCCMVFLSCVMLGKDAEPFSAVHCHAAPERDKLCQRISLKKGGCSVSIAQ